MVAQLQERTLKEKRGARDGDWVVAALVVFFVRQTLRVRHLSSPFACSSSMREEASQHM
jgi:hypothetical protein